MSQKSTVKKTTNSTKTTPGTVSKTTVPNSQKKIVKKSDEKIETKPKPPTKSGINTKNDSNKSTVKTVTTKTKPIETKSNSNSKLNSKPLAINGLTKTSTTTAKTSTKTATNTKTVTTNKSKTDNKLNVTKTNTTELTNNVKSKVLTTKNDLNKDKQKSQAINTKPQATITKTKPKVSNKIHLDTEDKSLKESSSDEQYASLATLDSSYKQKKPGKSSESIVAEPPSVYDTDIDEFNHNSNDNQTNDDCPSDYYDDFEEYESDFEEDNDEEEDNTDNNDDDNSNQDIASEEEEEDNNIDILEKKQDLMDTKQPIESMARHVDTTYESMRESVRSAKMRSVTDRHRNEANIRSKELLDIIKLNKIKFTNIDIPPINYDMFIKTFGRRDAKQVSCQTIDRQFSQTQTDSLEISDKWTQNPSATRLVAGNADQLDDKLSLNTHPIPKVNPFNLLDFLNKSQTLLNAIFDTEYDNQNNNRKNLPKKSEQFSTNMRTIKCLPLANKSPINYSFTNSLYLFCVQNFCKIDGSAEKSMITVWSLMSDKLDTADKVLICRSHITGAFAEQSLVVAAMIDGSLALWDLMEVSTTFKEISAENRVLVLRTPSYNSALTAREHNCPIVSIKKLSYTEPMDQSIHFVTADEMGTLVIWAINEVKEESNDLGLSQTTNHRITRISILNCLQNTNFTTNSLKITTITCQPNDWSNFYCGTDTGLVLRHTRHEELTTKLPNLYQKSLINSEWTQVSLIEFNLTDINNFLVAFTDGLINYYSITNENPLMIFNSNNDLSIIDIKWMPNSESKPKSFIALNNSNEIFIWHLNDNNNFGPIIQYRHSNNRWLTMNIWTASKTFLTFGSDCGQTLVFDLIDNL